ncbi:MAG: WYL domain-containing protein [Chloroflexi bacterium OHK40]
MNYWAAWLSDLAPTLQRAIARAQRISLPRGCDAANRTLRLRQALCHGHTVQTMFFSLPADVRAALWALRDCPRGLTPAELTQRYGPVRPFHELRDDPVPRSISERLLLLGWLLPRPATPRHPERWLLPPELRRWLPVALKLPELGAAPEPPVAPALRAAVAVLVAAAEVPLAVHADARPTATTLRRLAPRLAPLPAREVAPLLCWLLPLLAELHLLLPHGNTVLPSPAARTFLGLPADFQLQRLTDAWLRSPRPDALLRRCLSSDAGLLWPALRRRLLAWASALPTGRLFPAAALFPALTAAFGPLADAATHGLRVLRRTPWNPARAASVWETALAGPLTWLGIVAWISEGALEVPVCFVTRPAEAADGARTIPVASVGGAAWLYQAEGRVRVPYLGAGAELLALPGFARWEAADADGMVFRLDARSLTRARGQGLSLHGCLKLLERRAGPLPAHWLPSIDSAGATLTITPMVVALADDPAVLSDVARDRSTRRTIAATLAPGVAVLSLERAAAFTRAVERQGVAVHGPDDASTAPPTDLTPAECAILAALCAQARQRDGAQLVPPAVLAELERRLRARLEPRLQAAPWDPPPPGPLSDAELPEDQLADLAPEARAEAALHLVQRALRRRRALRMRYQPRDRSPGVRTVIPIGLEQHGDHWYLQAFCLCERAERTFRLDRMLGAVDVPLRATRSAVCAEVAPAHDASSPARSGVQTIRSSPREEAFPRPCRPRRVARTTQPPPLRAAPTPLVGVWLE